MTNKRGKNRRKPSRKRIIEKIRSCRGNISLIAKEFGYSRVSVYTWIQDDEEMLSALDDAREMKKDWVELKLDKQIEQGNWKAIQFFLETQAKDRGYVRKEEHAHSVSAPVQIYLPDNGRDSQT